MNTPPADHLQAGIQLAESLQPLDQQGNVDPEKGRIVMISMGMSNTSLEFNHGDGSFLKRVVSDNSLNPQLTIVNCAVGGRPVNEWQDPANDVWNICTDRLASKGVTPAQVQVAWMKMAQTAGALDACCGFAFPEHGEYQKGNVSDVIRLAKTNFPNLAITHLSSRTRAYTETIPGLNPEPIAYESNFAVKWVIEDQIEGVGNLNYDPANGPVVAPWLSWGPYLWIDGLNPRSDGLVWECEDTKDDGTHPSLSGEEKVGDQLIGFYKTAPTSTPWYLAEQQVGDAPSLSPGASVTIGDTPLSVQFSAGASDPDGTITEYAWNFDDGTSSLKENPVKEYRVPGIYNVRLTVTDDSGNTTLSEMTISVGQGQSPDLPNAPTGLRIISLN